MMSQLRTVIALAVVGAGALAAGPGALAAQALDPGTPLSRFNVDLWTEADGLPQNMASAIAQTPDGYLWLGMEEGLVRFDGVRFHVFGPATSDAFATPWVTALLADADGTLWIGTGGGGVVRLRDGEFTAFTTRHGLSNDHVRALFRDPDGTLWIGTAGGGLDRMAGGTFRRLDTAAGLPSDFVLAIARDAAGALWAGTLEGLARIDDRGVTVFTTDDGLPDDRIRALLSARDGSLWIGTTEGGLAVRRDGRFHTISTRDGLSSDYVTSLFEDAAGTLWVGTNGGGLNRLHDGRISSLTAADNLPGNLMLAVHGDSEGSLWMGLTGAGLARVRDATFTTVGRAEGLSANIALALLEARNGDLWIGTAGGGLNRLRDGRLAALTTADGLAHNVVIALAEARNGDLWVGAAAGGLSRIRDGRIRTFGREDGLVSTQTFAIAEDRDGSLWLATPGSGLQRWRPGTAGRGGPAGAPVRLTVADGLPDDFVTSLLLAPDGTLWIGTRGGLARLRDGRITGVPTRGPGDPSHNITGLQQGSGGAIWATTNSGLVRIRGDSVTLYDGAAGPFDRETHAAIEDGLGFLWLTSNQGIARVRLDDLDAVDDGRIDAVPFHRFGRADGLRTAEANGGVSPAALLRADGTVWFPTMRGAASVDPARVRVGRPVPTPVLERVITGDASFPAHRALTLPPRSRSLEFRFTAPTFVAPEEIRFRYRLDGFDRGWVDAGDRRTAFYTNLPPGDYRFRVASTRGAGEWSEAEADVALSLTPRFRETTVFFALVLLALGWIGFAGYRFRVRALTNRQAALLRVVAERERTERALRRSEERLRIALEAGRMGTWEWDVATGGVTASATAGELFGFAPASLDEARDRFTAITTHEDYTRLAELRALIAEGREEFEIRFPIVREDGGRRHVELRGRAFRGDDGRPIRVAGIAADITDFMAAQEELSRREEALRQAQKMEAVGRLAGGIAHDFNNLLTAIGGRTELLLEAAPEGHADREDLEEVRDAARRAASLTRQLLTFSRKQVLQPRVLDLNAVVEGGQRMLSRLIRADVILETRLDPELAVIAADPGGIEQVLLNLVLNAQDAMPDGGRVVIRTRNGAFPADHGAGPHEPDVPCVVLSVIDDGHGMSPETQRQIFEPFFTTKPVGKGTGLGLSTVYGIVRQSGGWIRADSAPGAGSSFHLYFPGVEGHADDSNAGVRADGAPGGAETILLAEDEPAVRSLVRKVLERRGYTVLEATDGHEALTLFQHAGDTIDLLVSDVVMPHMNGRELAERILERRPDIGVLLMSGYNEDEVLRHGVHGSGMPFVQKPFEPEAFARQVRDILDARAVAAGGGADR